VEQRNHLMEMCT